MTDDKQLSRRTFLKIGAVAVTGIVGVVTLPKIFTSNSSLEEIISFVDETGPNAELVTINTKDMSKKRYKLTDYVAGEHDITDTHFAYLQKVRNPAIVARNIEVIDLKNGSRKRIESESYFQNVRISNRIIAVRDLSDNRVIRGNIYRIESNEINQIDHIQVEHRPMELSPDGTKIATTVYMGGRNHLWIYNIDTKKLTKYEVNADTDLFWSPDSKRVLFREDYPSMLIVASEDSISGIRISDEFYWLKDNTVIFNGYTGEPSTVNSETGERTVKKRIYIGNSTNLEGKIESSPVETREEILYLENGSLCGINKTTNKKRKLFNVEYSKYVMRHFDQPTLRLSPNNETIYVCSKESIITYSMIDGRKIARLK